MPLRLIPDNTNLPFMKWARIRTPISLVLIVFMVAATPLYHNLFLFQGKERDPHLYLTLVNITLCGGLLLVIGEAL